MKIQPDILFRLERSDRLNFRVPETLKLVLKKEAESKGYSNLSKYLLSILLNRGSK